jgi:hypothetical protein
MSALVLGFDSLHKSYIYLRLRDLADLAAREAIFDAAIIAANWRACRL